MEKDKPNNIEISKEDAIDFLLNRIENNYNKLLRNSDEINDLEVQLNLKTTEKEGISREKKEKTRE